jgi:hypothetical protein
MAIWKRSNASAGHWQASVEKVLQLAKLHLVDLAFGRGGLHEVAPINSAHHVLDGWRLNQLLFYQVVDELRLCRRHLREQALEEGRHAWTHYVPGVALGSEAFKCTD